MTRKAFFRQDRTHIAIEVNLTAESRVGQQLHCQCKFHIETKAMMQENSPNSNCALKTISAVHLMLISGAHADVHIQSY